MMTGHERYQAMDADQYEKKTLMYRLCRVTSDRRLIPLIDQLENCRVLDVGLGTGSYTRYLVANGCQVVGLDQNPHLCRLTIPVLQGDALALSKVVGDERFDAVLSTWMTDYLSPEELGEFFAQAKVVLRPRGRLLTTVVRNVGVGPGYVWMARNLRGIKKFTQRTETIRAMLTQSGFKEIELVALNARLGIPWAYAVCAQ